MRGWSPGAGPKPPVMAAWNHPGPLWSPGPAGSWKPPGPSWSVLVPSALLLFLFSPAAAPSPSSRPWPPSASEADGGGSGKPCPGARTCLTVTLTLELWMYLQHTAQSSSDRGSTTEGEGGAQAGPPPSSSTLVRPPGATRTRGTAWYRRRLWPDITIRSPLCMNMAAGGSRLHRPPSRKMADCPKLSDKHGGVGLCCYGNSRNRRPT